MRFPLRIAWRYVFAKKSHNIINIISGISALGMAIGTAALLIILSVFEGFSDLIGERLSGFEADFEISRNDGALFDASAFTFGNINTPEGSILCDEVLRTRAFAVSPYAQSVVRLEGCGVHRFPPACDSQGRYCAEFGIGLGRTLKVSPFGRDAVRLYYPDKDANISNVSSTLHSVEVGVGSFFSINADLDNSTVLLNSDRVRTLIAADSTMVSAVQFFSTEDLSPLGSRSLRSYLQQFVPEGCILKDRYEANPLIYRMMRYEKLAIFLIMAFVILIVAFNIFSSLSMLIIDKKQDISTLKALGAKDGDIKKIFIFNGWITSLLGMAAGLLTGTAVCLAQQHWGLIKMNGNFVVDSYPVSLTAPNVLAVAVLVALIGYIVALLPARRVTKKE